MKANGVLIPENYFQLLLLPDPLRRSEMVKIWYHGNYLFSAHGTYARAEEKDLFSHDVFDES